MHARAAHRAFEACALVSALLSGPAAGTIPDGFSDDPVSVCVSVCVFVCCAIVVSRVNVRCSDSDAQFSNRAAGLPSDGRRLALLRLATSVLLLHGTYRPS